MTTAGGAAVRVAIEHLSKTFSGVTVLQDVSMDLRAGEVHGLIGMNGSGKSTLIKLLAGVHRPDAGGRIDTGSSEEATTGRRSLLRRSTAGLSIGFVHQDLGLVETATVADNFALALGYGVDRLGRARQDEVRAVAARHLAAVGVDVDPDDTPEVLGAADRTLVAMARALAQLGGTSPVLVLDEPTASLPRREIQRVLDVARRLAAEGASILLVTHKLDEILQATDVVTVLRDGRVVGHVETATTTESELVALMLGRRIEAELAQEEAAAAAEPTPTGPPVLELRGVGGRRVHDVDLRLAAGEVVAVTGLVGCGKSELGRMVAGASPLLAGEMQVGGRPHAPTSPRAALQSGVGYVPADRLTSGGILSFTASENITLPVLRRFASGGAVRRGRERTAARTLLDATDVQPAGTDLPFASYSGGNQQKVVLSRALVTEPVVLVVDEPTQGVDVGAIPVLYEKVHEAARRGAAVLVITSSIDEAVALASRAVVLDDGRVVTELAGDRLTVPALAEAVVARTSPGPNPATPVTREDIAS